MIGLEKKRFWYLAFKEYDIENLVRCLHEHSKSVERGRWRPEISDLIKYLGQDHLQVKALWQMFFDRKDVKDEVAVDIYNKMGGLRLNQMTSRQLEQKENMFVDFSLDDQLEFGLVVQIFQKARVGRST